MSFVFDEFVNVLKLVYRMEEGSENNGDEEFFFNVDKKSEEVLKEKCFRKYKYKKYLKLKLKDKKKYKK